MSKCVDSMLIPANYNSAFKSAFAKEKKGAKGKKDKNLKTFVSFVPPKVHSYACETVCYRQPLAKKCFLRSEQMFLSSHR